MYSVAVGSKCFKWKMVSMSGSNVLLLIALITRSAVNICGNSKGCLFVSLVSNRVSLEEV